MKYRKLGSTDLDVSLICLGTMTYGEQNTEAEGHEQLDYALDQGINFFDMAELYAIPPKADTQGRTEEIVGTWLAARKNRDKVVIATKVVGRSQMGWFRPWEGRTRLDRKNIEYAVDQSLKRLQTDYIDLYQLHWPDRPIPLFGGLAYTHKESRDEVAPEETLEVLADLVKAGKIRHVGLSNETPWGVSKFLQASETKNLPRVQSVQNAFNLINRTFEEGLSEFYHRDKVGLLAYSPLGQGFLTGKYLNGALPEGSRKALFQRQQRYESPQTDAAIEKYVALAKKHGLDPAQMALAFVNSRPYTTATIIGATTMAQLRNNIASIDLELSEEVLKEIDRIHLESPNPAP
ncbi:MAG: NADP(H)-dependent aldo-keto reductase [Chrysiogenetes bacterium]|nr:NADP(H)-dependent aldo-keto reductase [Chrysiogenetes bacterium]